MVLYGEKVHLMKNITRRVGLHDEKDEVTYY
jgi:hypothetical protein